MTDHLQPKPDDWDEEIDGPWDGDFDPADADDIELITSYLNRQLDPERTEEVRRRLEEDAEFRYLAEPLLLAWSVPKHLERFPRPEGERERAFEEFKRRTGFPNRPPPEPPPPPKPKRRWGRWLALVVVVIAGYGILAATQQPIVGEREYSEVPFDTGWISLNDGIEVRLSPGGSLRVDHRLLDGMRHVLLEGAARFRVSTFDSASPVLRGNALLVDTRAGRVTAGESDFNVTARGDTTLVHVLPLGARRLLQPELLTVTASIALDNGTTHLPLREHDGARLVTGQDPQRFTLPR
jgi:hypothetical protein